MPLSHSNWSPFRTFPSPNFGFWFGPKFGLRPGKWVVDPWNHLDQLPLSPQLRSDFAKFLRAAIDYTQSGVNLDDPAGGNWDDPAYRQLDAVTAEAVVTEKYGISREFLRLFSSPNVAAGNGIRTRCPYRR